MAENKKKESFWKKVWKKVSKFIPEPVKKIAKKVTLGVALLFASNTASANPTGNTAPENPDAVKIGVKINPSVQNASSTLQQNITDFDIQPYRAFTGKTYNEECNGSICWLASASRETYGKTNSMSAISSNLKYRGINQMSIHHTRQFIKYINKLTNASIEEFARTFDLQNISEETVLQIQNESKTIYNKLSKGGLGKKNWQSVAKQHEHVMTMLNQGYLTQKYNPENFSWIQKKLNKDSKDFDLSKVHPAILSEIHLLTIARPAWRSNITTKIETAIKGKQDPYAAINSPEFIEELAQLEKNKKVRKRVIKYTEEALDNKDIQWKEHEVKSLLAGVQANGSDGITWFDNQREELAQRKAKENLEKVNQEVAEKFQSGLYSASSLRVSQNFEINPAELAELSKKIQVHMGSTTKLRKDHAIQKLFAKAKNKAEINHKETLAERRAANRRARALAKLVKNEEKRVRAALRDKQMAQANSNIEINADTPYSDQEIATMIQQDLTQHEKLKGRDAKQAQRNLERFNNDEKYRNAVIAAYRVKLAQQNKA